MADKARWLKGKVAYTEAQVLSLGKTKPVQSCRSLLSVDDTIADILAALEAKDPGLNNTIIVFTSDQGVQFGEHQWEPKKVPYEGTIKVPFVVRADGLFNETASTDTANIVLNIDLAPTVLALTGASGTPGCPSQDPYRAACLARGGGFDGVSLVPLLGSVVVPIFEFSDRSFLIEMWDGGTFPEYCAVRTPDAKLIRYDKHVGVDFEGYDLTGAYGQPDPNELHSVVYSSSNGIARFRGGGGTVGSALYNDLYPQLVALCDPPPPDYAPF